MRMARLDPEADIGMLATVDRAVDSAGVSDTNGIHHKNKRSGHYQSASETCHKFDPLTNESARPSHRVLSGGFKNRFNLTSPNPPLGSATNGLDRAVLHVLCQGQKNGEAR